MSVYAIVTAFNQNRLLSIILNIYTHCWKTRRCTIFWENFFPSAYSQKTIYIVKRQYMRNVHDATEIHLSDKHVLSSWDPRASEILLNFWSLVPIYSSSKLNKWQSGERHLRLIWRLHHEFNVMLARLNKPHCYLTSWSYWVVSRRHHSSRDSILIYI